MGVRDRAQETPRGPLEGENLKLLHLSDIHLGKRVNGFSMLEDQACVLKQILDIAAAEAPDAVLIAGDVYDKPVPPEKAVELFDDFLVTLANRGTPVFVISGNHDSAERVAFGGRLMDARGIHMAPVYHGEIAPVTLEDAYGPCRVYMLPFVRPVDVRSAWPEDGIDSYTDALRAAIDHMHIDRDMRNVLVAHQFVTGARRSESEDISVGGLDNVDAQVFEGFDYVALGHLHSPQNLSGRLRYCGTPLKYSFSEAGDHKSVTLVELGEKGEIAIRTAPLTPRRDLREIRGTYDELTLRAHYQGTATDDYLHIVLTDETDVPDAMARLRVIYPNLMKLDYDNVRTRTAPELARLEADERKSEIELFEELYEMQNGRPMSDEQRRFSRALFEQIREAAQ